MDWLYFTWILIIFFFGFCYFVSFKIITNKFHYSIDRKFSLEICVNCCKMWVLVRCEWINFLLIADIEFQYEMDSEPDFIHSIALKSGRPIQTRPHNENGEFSIVCDLRRETLNFRWSFLMWKKKKLNSNRFWQYFELYSVVTMCAEFFSMPWRYNGFLSCTIFFLFLFVVDSFGWFCTILKMFCSGKHRSRVLFRYLEAIAVV